MTALSYRPGTLICYRSGDQPTRRPMPVIPTIDQIPPAAYTAEMLERDLLNLCREYPANRNPYDRARGVCRYRAGEGMCLIGLWLELRGHPYREEWEGDAADNVLRNLRYSSMVADVAREYQYFADQGARPWGKVFPTGAHT